MVFNLLETASIKDINRYWTVTLKNSYTWNYLELLTIFIRLYKKGSPSYYHKSVNYLMSYCVLFCLTIIWFVMGFLVSLSHMSNSLHEFVRACACMCVSTNHAEEKIAGCFDLIVLWLSVFCVSPQWYRGLASVCDCVIL